MRFCKLLVIVTALVISSLAQNDADGPTNEKAQKTYKQALDYLKQHMTGAALDSFKKADKQDEGHCRGCQTKMVKYGIELGEWKTAETAGEEMVAEAQGGKDLAIAHYRLGMILREEGYDKRKDEIFARAHEEMTKALAAAANFPDAIYVDGQILAHLKQDDAAKKQFEQFVKMRPEGDPLVVLSVSLDDDERKWKDFVTKNEMTWPQYRDGGFTGPVATLFYVRAIPQTFTIDADGVLQDQHIGDAAIEGKLKKLVARARDLQVAETPKQ